METSNRPFITTWENLKGELRDYAERLLLSLQGKVSANVYNCIAYEFKSTIDYAGFCDWSDTEVGTRETVFYKPTNADIHRHFRKVLSNHDVILD